MIEFKNEKEIKEWIVLLDNHVTILKANIKCDKRMCSIMEHNTDGIVYKSDALDALEAIVNCASMTKQYLENK